MEAVRRLFQIARKRRRARNDVEQNVPLRSEHHQWAEPDIGVQIEIDDPGDEGGKSDISGKRREELRERLQLFGQRRAQTDPYADRNPDQCG